MSFMEFWGEQTNPGSVGRVGISTEHAACTSPVLVWGRVLFLGAAVPVLWMLAAMNIPLPAWQAWTAVIGGTLIYAGIAYFVDPQPDMENIGWCGGFVDNPCRYSDDLNRNLVGLQILFGPGRFMVESAADWLALMFPPNDEDSFDPPSTSTPHPIRPSSE